MNNTNQNFSSPQRQQGAVLIVALVILAAITVIGVANMKATTMEMRMATSSLKRAEEFAFAERALTEAENNLKTRITNHDDLLSDKCTTADCFTAACNDGFCFEGSYNSENLYRSECEVAPSAGSTERVEYWKDSSVWSTGAKHKALTLNHTVKGTSQSRTAKYIAEFLCFVDSGETKKFGIEPTDNSGLPIFRVTVFVENDSDGDDRVPIMLQSNYILKI